MCGRIYLRGREVPLPEAIRKALLEATAEAAKSGKEARESLEVDSGQRIERWFSVVYHRGYLHGFFRALAYFQHHAKEGRLVRLRHLWDEGVHCTDDDVNHVVMFTPEEYNEFEQLLRLSFGVKLDAKSSSNADTAGQGRDALVSGQSGTSKAPTG